MRKVKCLLLVVLCISMLSACSSISNIAVYKDAGDNSVLAYEQTKYDVYVDKEKIGTLTHEFKHEGKYINVKEVKEYNGKFFTSEDSEVKNIKNYLLDKDFSLINLYEEEYINDKRHLINKYTVKTEDSFREVLAEFNDKKLQRVFPNNGISMASFSSGQFDLVFNKKIESLTYYFYYNILGYVENFYVIGEEELDTELLGKRKAYKLVNESLNKYYIWIDVEKKIILRKEEFLDEKFIVTSILSEIK